MPDRSAWRARRVVVTGAAGFLSGPTDRRARLRDLGAVVIGASRQVLAPEGEWVRTQDGLRLAAAKWRAELAA